MDFSVLIIVKGRGNHLTNVLKAIEAATIKPQAVIIVHINEAAYKLSSDLPIKQYELYSRHNLPLAQARNLAASKATTHGLVFLDVDCIPAPDCFNQLINDLGGAELIMTDPRYIAAPVDTIDFKYLENAAQQNSSRGDLNFGITQRYEMFWSLGFAILRRSYTAIDGFDESYTGYGGEDTDFAFTARKLGLRLYMSQAKIYHQYHDSFDPPLNWIEDIVSNAIIFKHKWQVWPMRDWLKEFAVMGYVLFTEDELKILKLPTEQEIFATLKTTNSY